MHFDRKENDFEKPFEAYFAKPHTIAYSDNG